MISKHGMDFERAVLANANRGGENVHSGIVIGAAIGASVGADGIPSRFKEGLRDHHKIKAEIEAFVHSVGQRTAQK